MYPLTRATCLEQPNLHPSDHCYIEASLLHASFPVPKMIKSEDRLKLMAETWMASYSSPWYQYFEAVHEPNTFAKRRGKRMMQIWQTYDRPKHSCNEPNPYACSIRAVSSEDCTWMSHCSFKKISWKWAPQSSRPGRTDHHWRSRCHDLHGGPAACRKHGTPGLIQLCSNIHKYPTNLHAFRQPSNPLNFSAFSEPGTMSLVVLPATDVELAKLLGLQNGHRGSMDQQPGWLVSLLHFILS